MAIDGDLSENQYIVTHEVGHGQNGIRLDRFLMERYRRRSREALKRAIDSGAILLERKQGPHLSVGRLKPGTQLVTGDEVLVVSQKKPEPPVDFNYRVVFEDEVLFVIDKPANLPVHPAGRYFFNTLLVHLRTQGHEMPLKAEREYFLVHRIDKETSGILVLTKERAACAHLTRQFAARKTEKRYLAIARGITLPEFRVDGAIKRQTESLISLKMIIAPESEGGYPSLTEFTTRKTFGDFSLVECRPKTGRQHQIRLHLASVGHSIVGDKLYGLPEEDAALFYDRVRLSPEAEARLLLPRHALHASAIRFEHPITGRMLEFESPLPRDLTQFLDQYSTPTPSLGEGFGGRGTHENGSARIEI